VKPFALRVVIYSGRPSTLHRNRRAGRAFNTIREKAPESSRFSTVTD
jgi:hypothetical protein